MIFSSRRRTGPDPHLEWKVRIFFLGAVLGLVGVYRESSLLIGGAVLVLLLGVLLRLVPGARELGEEEWSGGDGAETRDAQSEGGAGGRSEPPSVDPRP